jgi:hypothetical protein
MSIMMICSNTFIFPASATIGFSQANYTLIEGGASVQVCLVVVSLTGQLTETVFVGLSALDSRTTGEFSFEGAQVGDMILCLAFINSPDDNAVEVSSAALLSAFVEASPSIVFAPERDTAILIFVDNDRMFLISSIKCMRYKSLYLTPLTIKQYTPYLGKIHSNNFSCSQ